MARKANLKKGMKGPQKMRYQMGGDFMEPNKELTFGGMKYQKGGFKKKKTAGNNPGVISPATSGSYKVKKKDIGKNPINERMKSIVDNASAMSYSSSVGDKGQYQPPMSITSSMLKSLAGYGAESRATMGAAEVKPKKKESGGAKPGTYSYAKERNPNLDKLIAERKKYARGTDDYNRVQNQINRAYNTGPMRKEISELTPKSPPKNTATPTIQKPASASAKPTAPAAKPKSFSDAFAAARKAGKTTFTYNGKTYGTRKAGETQEQYRAAISTQPAPRKAPSQVPNPRPAPTIQKKAPAGNTVSSASSNKKQFGGTMKGNKATAKPPMKPIGKKNNTKTTKL